MLKSAVWSGGSSLRWGGAAVVGAACRVGTAVADLDVTKPAVPPDRRMYNLVTGSVHLALPVVVAVAWTVHGRATRGDLAATEGDVAAGFGFGYGTARPAAAADVAALTRGMFVPWTSGWH